MKSVIAILLSMIMVIVPTLGSIAEGSFDLSASTTQELSDLRDAINHELNLRKSKSKDSKIVVENEIVRIQLTSIEDADKDQINDYYRQFMPGTATSQEGLRLAIVLVVENKSDKTFYRPIIRNASINGWMVSTFVGMLEVTPGNKARGVVDIDLGNCDAEKLDDVKSLKLLFKISDTHFDVLAEPEISIVQTDDGWMLQ